MVIPLAVPKNNLVVMICQCSVVHGFSRLYNRVSSQYRE
ncbi:hypothetical protein AC88_5085 [Escherichia coli 3-267-03_S4_C1]|nr:hypothetical protein AC88_5085 [Escherichia coli 3-267-03_S4_C1]